MNLTRSQQLALNHISKYVKTQKKEAECIIQEILQMSNIPNSVYEQAVFKLKKHARVALHFHPDRLDPKMKTVAETLLEQGIYKSQFETLLSNGSVSAYPGGQRDLWEERIFAGAYQLEDSTNEERPKYGALNLLLHPEGPAPRFDHVIFFYRRKSHIAVHTLTWIQIVTRRIKALTRNWIVLLLLY